MISSLVIALHCIALYRIIPYHVQENSLLDNILYPRCAEDGFAGRNIAEPGRYVSYELYSKQVSVLLEKLNISRNITAGANGANGANGLGGRKFLEQLESECLKLVGGNGRGGGSVAYHRSVSTSRGAYWHADISPGERQIVAMCRALCSLAPTMVRYNTYSMR